MGLRVLIAEDEVNIVESLDFILRREGYDVDSVGDGEAALAAMRHSNPPNALILDVMLPQRNGFEVLKALKGDARLAHIPVLILTAKAQAHDREQATAMGADAYITKPFSNRELLEVVGRLVGR
ncbi:response regulator [Variovorax dokdonensis]|uniref:Response regulator n=1 Tax=Variovorax dokdonensis TaxID=344883 RepID=A0ABT7N7D2_9BURK|nr:response regulator [Variovorax dokdonensis]MDM0043836.1 response regulator [Variovorax dokdonensis]